MELTSEHYRLGDIAYQGYRKQSGGVSLVSGEKLPDFGALKQEIKDAWAAAAIAIGREIHRQSSVVVKCTCRWRASSSAYAINCAGFIKEISADCPVHGHE